MWDLRYPQLAADRLTRLHVEAAVQTSAGPGERGGLRRRAGLALMRLGERLAAPAVPTRPAALSR